MYQTERIDYHLDSDGDVTYDHEPDYHEDGGDSQNDGYFCNACRWAGHSLDEHCSDDHCECDECDPCAVENEGDEPNEDVVLVLSSRFSHPLEVTNDTPPEVRYLASDACRWYVLIPRWRGAELFEDGSLYNTIEIHLNAPFPVTDTGEQRPFSYDHDERKVVTV